ncbi:MAG: ABC transporter ATP-binding protein [Turicibacter sp.]|nr:ABC transporter ATP-binding protein [Turicibacter sp.]
MIEVSNLRKSIDGKDILLDIHFQIPKGSIVGLLGRNGAGKTTLLRTLVGILKPTAGTITLEGVDIIQQPEAKEKVVYVPDQHTFLSGYKVKELVAFYASIYPEFDKEKCLGLLELYKLPSTSVRSYSKGMKALLAIILAFATGAEYIILDEPTSGLDPIVKRQVLKFILNEVAEHGTTVLISTHHLDEVEKIADTVIFLNGGTIESITSLEATKEQFTKVQVAFKEGKGFEHLPNVKILSQVGKVSTILVDGDVGATLKRLEAAGPLFMEELPMSLEDIFITTLGGDDYVA